VHRAARREGRGGAGARAVRRPLLLLSSFPLLLLLASPLLPFPFHERPSLTHPTSSSPAGTARATLPSRACSRTAASTTPWSPSSSACASSASGSVRGTAGSACRIRESAASPWSCRARRGRERAARRTLVDVEADHADLAPHSARSVVKDRIGDVSIKLQFGSDEAWTRALRHVRRPTFLSPALVRLGPLPVRAALSRATRLR